MPMAWCPWTNGSDHSTTDHQKPMPRCGRGDVGAASEKQPLAVTQTS